MTAKMNCFWIQNTDSTLPRLCRASQRVALIPLTSIESHGPHLPLGSDPLTIEYVLKKVAQRETIAILPILPYSYVADARMLPGAVHIRTNILEDLVENICDEVSRNGFDKVILLQGHGGNVTLDHGFMRRMLEREKPYFIYSVPVFAGQGESIMKLMETQDLGHACEFETSLNMAACPDLVNLKVLKGRTFPTQKGLDIRPAQTPVGWVVEHPYMAVGTPQKGTREKGEKVAEIWAQAIVDQLRKIKRDRRGPAVWAQYWKRVNRVRFQKGG